jgi:putative iron-regulated protein
MKHTLIGLGALALAATAPGPSAAHEAAEVLDTYADIAEAGYLDSLAAARDLRRAVEALIEAPSAETMQAARAAWIRARVPYQQTEVFRFGNPIVDDWEGRVNAWPLDEGLIDYVEGDAGPSDENPLGGLNVIAHPRFTLSGREIDASRITPELLREVLHEADGIEANVATGYHAIEFLLWGQDLNGHAPGAGNRPWTDYARGEACTHGNCDRRAEYGPRGARRAPPFRPTPPPGCGPWSPEWGRFPTASLPASACGSA